MASAGTGTRIGGDTSRVKGLGQGEEKPPAKAPAAEKEKGSPFGDLADAPAAASKKREGRKRKPTPAAWWKRPAVLAGVAVAVLVLAVGAWLLAGVVFKAKVKTADGEAVIVVEVDRPGAEVLVDGDTMTVTWGDDGKKAEIRVKPGTHKVEVKKDGLTLRGEEVEIEDGGRKIVSGGSTRLRLPPLLGRRRVLPIPRPRSRRPPTNRDAFGSRPTGISFGASTRTGSRSGTTGRKRRTSSPKSSARKSSSSCAITTYR